jgi:hypothetical protein
MADDQGYGSIHPLADYAELLGAVFGDGYIKRRATRRHDSWIVSVCVSVQYPVWAARVPELFEIVFGRVSSTPRKGRKTPTKDCYVTTSDLYGLLRVRGKYDEKGRMAPPSWITSDAEYTRRFMLGLVETDGMFKATSDKRYSGNEWARFAFTQKNEYLVNWFADRLREHGFEPALSYGEQAGVWSVRVNRQVDVQRLGEWLGSCKWKALLESGYEPHAGRRAAGVSEAKILKTVPMADQERWRALRQAGASVVAIARDTGRANNVVHDVIRDIVPTKNASAQELGLTVRPRFPMERRVPRAEVEQWRKEVEAGESARQVAIKYGRPWWTVTEATCDLKRPRNMGPPRGD